MRRRWRDPLRPPIPSWLLDAERLAAGVLPAWCGENGYTELELIRARRDARRARWGIDATA